MNSTPAGPSLKSAITRRLTYEGVPVWRHVRVIQWVLQIVSGVLVVVLVAWFFTNIVSAINERDIPFGFSFLTREYQTPIGEHFIPYDSSDTFRYALFVGITNTLLVSVMGVILATLLGIVVGVARLSSNWLVSKLALAYIEFFRNVPLLVQLLFWLFIVLTLPPVRRGYAVENVLYVNNGGISFVAPAGGGNLGTTVVWLGLAVLAGAVGLMVHRMMARREINTGRASYPVLAGFAATIGIAAVAWLVMGSMTGAAPLVISSPAPQGQFGQISDGYTVRAGLVVVLGGLVLYTATYIAELVRAGIQSVERGQVEAARALGLSPMQTLRSVTFPQAMRVIVPPLISQYLNLTKNSSLGGAVGYTELTNIGITMTQTAPAISIFILIMLAYLAMSLTYSLIGNLYNQRIAFKGR